MCLVNDNLTPYVTLKAKSEIIADIGLRLKTSTLLVISGPPGAVRECVVQCNGESDRA